MKTSLRKKTNWDPSIKSRGRPVHVGPCDSRDTHVEGCHPRHANCHCTICFILIFNLRRERLGRHEPHSCLYLTCLGPDQDIALPPPLAPRFTEEIHFSPSKWAVWFPLIKAVEGLGVFSKVENSELTTFWPAGCSPHSGPDS